MSKERLEEIKKLYNFWMKEDESIRLLPEDIEWLIEQAERVQELEDIIHQDERQAVLEGLYEQNQRYREAFRQIKLQILLEGAIESHRENIIEIIDEALEESE